MSPTPDSYDSSHAVKTSPSLDKGPEPLTFSLLRLEHVVSQRLQSADSKDSYIAALAAKGRAHIVRKCGEEAVEVLIAAMGEDTQAITAEASDLVFHLTILLVERGLSWRDIAATLEHRHGTSGLAEKAARQPE